jgi:gliding motility-associated-like protein
MNNTGAGNYSFSWSGLADLDNLVESLAKGAYNVTVTDANGCTVSVTNIEVKECAAGGDCYTASSVMTPNGDNFNDLFIINCVDDAPADLTVFDRWGRTVYTQINYDNTWQGINTDGTELKEGAYMWVLNVNFGQGRREIYKGTVTLLRSN